MLPITPELKEAFNPNDGQGGRFIDYAVRFEVINHDAQGEAQADAQEDVQISRLNQVVNRNSDALDFASFEPGGWPLDGSKAIPPKPDEEPEAEIGLVMADISDEDGYYSTPQVITLTTQGAYNLLAVTLDFGYSPAADFVIDLYGGAALLHRYEVTGNEGRLHLMRRAVDGVTKIVVSITRSAMPRRKARLVEVVYGVLLTYDKSTSDGMDIAEVIDPLNERVPASDMRLIIDNFGRNFNLFDPTSLYEYFQDRQALSPRIGAQTEDGSMGYVPMGRYYLQRPLLKGNLAKLELKAVNLLGVLSESTYAKGTYKTASLAEFAQDIAEDAGVSVEYPVSWTGTIMTAYIPSVSHAEAFRMLAQATGTLLRVNRDDEIVFQEIGQGILETFSDVDYKTGGFSPSDDDIVNTVQVEATSYGVLGEVEELAKAEGAGVHHLKYDASTWQTASVTNGSLVSAQYFADNAVVEISGGEVAVSGKKITSNKSVVSTTSAQPHERQYVYEVKGQPFIQPPNAQAVAQHCLGMKALRRKTVKVKYRGYPYIETGDLVSFEAGPVETGAFIVSKNELKLGGGMTGVLESREAP